MFQENWFFYSLDAIIAVVYRVKFKETTDFKIWATNNLKEFIKKGFVLNDEFLKNGPEFGKDYFKELLEKIRSIRTSERRIWQKITDIFAECSIDYEKNSEITQKSELPTSCESSRIRTVCVKKIIH